MTSEGTTATTTTTTTAIVTTTVSSEGTTTTAICTLQDLMQNPTALPLSSVVPNAGSSEVLRPYEGKDSTWVVRPSVDESDEKPSFLVTIDPATTDSAQVTSVELGKDSNVQSVDVTMTTTDGNEETLEDLPVTPSGQVFLPKVYEDVETIKVTPLKPVDETIDEYRLSPSVQGCFRAPETTIVTTTPTTTGVTTTPSTTTVTTVSTTGTVATTESMPSTTTALTTAPATTTVEGRTTTTAIVTTTTTPIGTTTVTTTTLCPLTKEMPSQPPQLSDNQFTVEKGDGSPSDAQPGRTGWQPSTSGDENPVMRITFPKTTTGNEPYIQSVTVREPVARYIIVRIYYIVLTTPKYTVRQEVPESGVVTVTPNPEGKPEPLSELTIELGEPKNPADEKYDTTVELLGCFEPAIGE